MIALRVEDFAGTVDAGCDFSDLIDFAFDAFAEELFDGVMGSYFSTFVEVVFFDGTAFRHRG